MTSSILHEVNHNGNKIIAPKLEEAKISDKIPTTPQPNHVYFKNGVIHYRNTDNTERPIHENAITEIVDPNEVLIISKNGTTAEIVIAPSDGTKPGLITPEQYALLASATSTNIPGSLVLRGTIISDDGVNVQLPTVLGSTFLQGQLEIANGYGLFANGISLLNGAIAAQNMSVSNTNPANENSVTNISFVQNLIQNALRDAIAGLDRKAQGVRVAVDVDTPLTSSFGTYDGVAISATDANKSLLLYNQTNPAENGAYNITPTGLVRRADSNTETKLTNGASYQVEAGTKANHIFTLITQDGYTLNTDSLTFLDISGVNVLSAGSGISIVNQRINALTTIDRTYINADGNIDIAPAYDQSINDRIANATNTRVIDIAHGGTGATTPQQARINIGAVENCGFMAGDGVATEFLINHGLKNSAPFVYGYYLGKKLGDVDFDVINENEILVRASLGEQPIAANSLSIYVLGKNGSPVTDNSGDLTDNSGDLSD